MKKLGITGGIGAGKSVVISFLQSMQIPVYIADEAAKRLMNTSHQIRKQLINEFGAAVYENDCLNKALLTTLIFNQEKNLKLVNAIVHPVVKEDFLSWSKKYENQPVVALESAILFESGFHRLMDCVWTVWAPTDIRIDRVINRENSDRENVLKRIENQLPEEEKGRLSDQIIKNDNIQPLIPQIETLIHTLCQE